MAHVMCVVMYSDDMAEAKVRHMCSCIISHMKSLAFSAGN